MKTKLQELESRLEAFDHAKETLEGYYNDSVPLPTNGWDRDEIIRMQRQVVAECFNGILFLVMDIEEKQKLPVKLQERVANLKK